MKPLLKKYRTRRICTLFLFSSIFLLSVLTLLFYHLHQGTAPTNVTDEKTGWVYPTAETLLNSRINNLTGSEILYRSWSRHLIVSEKSKLIYCPIPKAANSNWKYLIRKHEGLTDYDDLHKAHIPSESGLRYLSDYSPKEIDSLLKDSQYFKFSFVRDPYKRILSCYMDKFQNRNQTYVENELRSFLGQLYDWSLVKNWDLDKDPRPSFGMFVDELAKTEAVLMNGHWMPQSLLCGFGEMPYDFVGKFERFQEDTRFILEKLGWKSEKFPTQQDIGFPSSGASSKDAEELYTLEIMFKVRTIFDMDFQLLGY